MVESNGWRGETAYLLRHGTTLGFSNLGAYAMVFTDSVMIAWLGADEFSGVSLGMLVYTVVLQFGIGFSYIVAPQIAEALGKNRKILVQIIVAETIRLALIFSAITMPLIYIGAMPLNALGDMSGYVGYMSTYLTIVFLAILPQMLTVTLGEICVGFGRSQVVLFGTIFAFISNIVLNFLLIFILDFGVAGVAASTVATSLLTLGLVAFLARRCAGASIFFGGYKKLRKAARTQLMRLAFPLAFLEILLFAMFAQTTVLVGSSSADALPAHLIVFQITEGIVLLFFGYGEALATRVAALKGIGNNEAGLRKAILVSFVLSALIGLSSMLCLWMLGGHIFEFYAQENPSFEDSKPIFDVLIILGALLVAIQSMQITMISALRGLGETQYTTVVSLLCLGIIGLGGGAVSVTFFSGGVASIWSFLTIATLAVGLLCFLRLQKIVPFGNRSQKDLVVQERCENRSRDCPKRLIGPPV